MAKIIRAFGNNNSRNMTPSSLRHRNPTTTRAVCAMRCCAAKFGAADLITLFNEEIAMPIVIETIQEFDARHTKDGPKLGDADSGCELFPDCAIRTSTGEQLEPPTEPSALLKAKRRYVAVQLRLEE